SINDEDLNSENDLQDESLHEVQEDPYAFVQEIVKHRPGRLWKVFIWSVAIITGACIFGGISGLIFRQTNTPEPPESHVSLSGDDGSEERSESTPEGSDQQGDKDSTTSQEADQPGQSASDDGTDASDLSEEELLDRHVEEYQALNKAMSNKADQAAGSLVTVKSITSTADWFNTINENASSASGLIIADTEQALLVLTEKRVVVDGARLVVTFGDGTTVEAVPIKGDDATGICVLKVDRSLLTEDTRATVVPAVLGNSNLVSPGDVLIAVGAPTGQTGSFDFGEATGVSDVMGVDDNSYRILSTNIIGATDGSGVLVDMRGQVIGIIKPDLGSGKSNTIAALGITSVRNLIEKLSNNTPISYLGILGDTVTEQIAAETGLPLGIYVVDVTGDSPAFMAGIQPGDVLVKMNNDTLSTMLDYSRLLQGSDPGTEITLQVMRQGDAGYVPIDFTMTVGSY
ncbi:MAG: PDZ domain-containing protein, partial [Lachnospiraceae bacterium]|nr:PDZ domain-containing protein [Candidatus Equihabitans merdae]